MSVTLYIDSRESKLIQYLTHINVNFIQKQLDIGDILIESIEPQFNIIIERKTYSDLVSSIKDGRYKEQKIRLLATNPPHNSVYIFEGNPKEMDESILNGVIYHTMFRDKMHILFTHSVEETGKIVCDIFAKCQKNPQKFVATETDYLSQVKVKTCKAENIDKDTCFILQLCQIPMISHIIAKEIASRYKSWKELITALDASENKLKLLTSIPMIGSKKAQMIINYLE